MSIFRINKTKDYTIMSNCHLREKNMSLKAKGLLSVMLSLPESWDYSIKGLISLCKENESAIHSTLKELKEFGYLIVDKLMPDETNSGRIEYVYNIFEIPHQNTETRGEKQVLENLGVESLGVDTNIYTTNNNNINNINNKILNNKILNNINYSARGENDTLDCNTENNKRNRFIPPTYEQVLEYAKTRGRTDLAKQFYEYFTENNWYDSKGNKVKRWKGKFLTWEGFHPRSKEHENDCAVNNVIKRLGTIIE